MKSLTFLIKKGNKLASYSSYEKVLNKWHLSLLLTGRIDFWGNLQPTVLEKETLASEGQSQDAKLFLQLLQTSRLLSGEEKMCWILERMAPFLFTEKKKVQTTKFRETISLRQPVAISQAIVKA